MDFFPVLAEAATATTSGEAASLLSGASLLALATLTMMEIVLGIDNVVFVAILVGKLPKEQQKSARNIGMGLALAMRLGLLFSIKWVMGLTEPVLNIPEGLRPENWAAHAKTGLSWRDVILLSGGLFLLYKASKEIFEKLEGDHEEGHGGGGRASYGSIIFQMIILDLVFSLDSVITAVGMVQNITIMVIAMLIAVSVMIASAATIGDFVQRHPSVKILALSFLNLIGFMLILEASGQHVNKGYIYSAMAFSLGVELLNMRFRKKQKPPFVLHEPTMQEAKAATAGMAQ